MNVLCGHLVPYSETWPRSGSMRNGAVFAPKTSVHPTAGSECSSSPGLLRTPTAQLADNGGSQHPDKRKAGGHGPTLADEVEHLLPTPQAHDKHGAKTPEQVAAMRARGAGVRNLNETVVNDLLPTPTAGDSKAGGSRNLPGSKAHPGVSLTDAIQTGNSRTPRLLPSPTARLGDDTSRGADPARYKGPQSLNGRRSNLDDAVAAVETRAPWLGDSSHQPSADGKPPSDAQLPGQLSLDELASD